MKFTCQLKDLRDRTNIVRRAIPNNPTHPVLGCLSIVSKESGIEITGYNLSLGIRAFLSAEVTGRGTIAVPAKLFGDIVSKLPDGEVTVSSENGTTTIESLSGSYGVREGEAEDYPDLPKIDDNDGKNFKIGVTEFQRGASVTFAASTEETKQILVGVNIEAKTDSYQFAATDGHRLATVEVERVEAGEFDPFEVTIPASTIKELNRAIAKQSGDIKFTLSQEQVVFDAGGDSKLKVISRLLDGTYPKYRQLIPVKFEGFFTVDRAALLASLSRVAIISRNNKVKIVVTGDRIVLSAEFADVGSAREELPVTCSIDAEFTVALNLAYLTNSIENLSSTEIEVYFNSPTSPIVIKPVGEGKTRHLLMPIQIRDSA